jgi:iron complex outermembrane receptor protein
MGRGLRIFMSCLLSLLLIIASVALAEEKEEKEEAKLEEIVVTATKTEKEVSEAPASTSVVTKKDIEKRNIQAIDQALNTLPGVFTTRARVTDFSPQISLRGIPYGFGRTLVMMDGITITDTMQGTLWSITGLVPEDMERIEVVRGPFSSLYGGNAMGGVVNIITRMPEKREFTIKSGYGSSWERGEAADDLRRFYVSYGDRFKDKLSIFLSYGIKGSNGYPTSFNIQRTQPPADITGWSYTTDPMGNIRYLIGDRGDFAGWDDNITLKAGYDFSKTSKINLSFYRNRFNYHYDDPHTYLRDEAGNPVWSYGAVKESSFLTFDDFHREQNLYHISYETEISKVKTKFSFSLVDATFQCTGVPAGGLDSDHPDLNHYDAELQFTVPLFERHLLTFGGFFRHNWGSFDQYGRTNKDRELLNQGKGKDRTYALFVQDEIMILDNLTAYIGFRQDWWETYDGYVYLADTPGYPISYESRDKSSFSPKVALVYKPFVKTTLRASAGKAFMPPTILELYCGWSPPGIGITYAENPDLKPETTISWDIGAEQVLWKGAKIKATYFENYMEDLVYYAMTTPTLYERKNVGKAESKGVELEAEQGIGNWLRLFANFTYTDSEITENPAKPTTEGKRLTMLPETMFNIGADLTKGPFSASLVGRYVSKIYRNDDNSDSVDNVYYSYDPYFIADAKVSYNITKFASLSFSVDNIFDRDYFYSDKAPGRAWFGELTLSF